MRFRFLLFFILVFFLGAFSVKAQDLVYNGDVKIEIFLSRLQAKLVNENKDGTPDNEFRINKKYGTGNYFEYKFIKGTCSDNPPDWEDWTGVSVNLPYKIHSGTYSPLGKTLKEYFGVDSKVSFMFEVWEHEGAGFMTGSKKHYYQALELDLLDIIKNDPNPGWHKKRWPIGNTENWALELEYSITPPAPTIENIISEIKEEESDVSISCQDLGANIKYEWQMNIDKKTTTRSEPTGLTDWEVYNECMKGCDQSGINQREQRVAVEKAVRPIEDGPCDEQCLSVAEIYEDVVYTVWEYPKDKILNTYRTDLPSLTYHIPEFEGFTKNYKFIAYSYLETKDKATLKSLDPATIAIVDVFPHYPIIENIAPVNISCYCDNTTNYLDLEMNQKDGSVSFTIKGDVNVGVDYYEINVIKRDNLGKYSISRHSEKTTANSVKVPGLDAGDYKIVVSNYFNRVDPSGVNKKVPFMVGEGSGTFSIGKPGELKIKTYDIVSNKVCDQYEITNIVSDGGVKGEGYKYSFFSNKDFSNGPLLLDVSSVKNGSDFNFTLWLKDDNACLVKSEEVKKRNVQLDLDLKITDNIECYGEEGSVSITAAGGVEPYVLKNETNGKSLAQGIIAGFSKGNNIIHITDAEGCSFDKSIYLNEPTQIIMVPGSYSKKDVACFGLSTGSMSVSFKGGMGKYSVKLFKNGETNELQEFSNINPEELVSFTNLIAEDYFIIVSDEKSCSRRFPETEFFTINQPEIIKIEKITEASYKNADGKAFDFSCSNSSENISVKVSGGLPTYTVSHKLVTETNVATDDPKSFSIDESSPKFEITDQACTVTRELVLSKPSALELTLIPSIYESADKKEAYNIKKYGGTDKIEVEVKGGITPYKIQLFKDGVFDSETTSLTGLHTFNNLGVGVYTVKVNGALRTNLINGKEIPEFNEACFVSDAILLTQPAEIKAPISYHKTNGYDIKCNGGNGAITVKPTGGIMPYTIRLNGPGGIRTFDNLLSDDKYIDNLSAGTYELSVEDNYETVVLINDAIVIEQPKELELDLSTTTYKGGVQIKCSNLLGYVDVTPNGGAGSSYELLQMCDDKADVLKKNVGAIRFDTLDEGYYTYRLTDINGCSIEESIDIKKPEELKIQFGDFSIPSCHEDDMGDDIKKKDGQIELTISGGATLGYKTNIYQLDGTQPSISIMEVAGGSTVFTGLTTGRYKFITTDGNGCLIEDFKDLDQPQQLRIEEVEMKVTEPKCFGYSDGLWTSTILGGTTSDGQYTYVINEGAENTTGSVFNQNNLSAGDYKIEITDDKGCYFSMVKKIEEPKFIINQLDVLGIDILKEGGVADFDCFGSEDGDTLTVNGGTANYTVQINKEGILYQELNEVAEGVGISAKDLGAGSYSILTTDKRGCQSDKIDFELNQPEEIKFNREEAKYADKETKEVFDYTCFGATETIGVSVKGGFAPYEITYNGETKVITKSEGYVDFDVSGTKPVFKIVDFKGCPKEYKPTLKEPLELELELSKNKYKSDDYNIKCFGGTDSIWAKATGGIRPYTFELLDENNALIATKVSNNETFFDELTVGLYHVKVTGAYNSSCSAFDDISLKQPDPLNANINLSDYSGFEIKCNGLTDTVRVNALGGFSPYTIHLEGMGIELEYTDVSDEQKIFKDLSAGKYQVSITDQFKACEFLKDTVLREPTSLKFDIETSHYEGDFQIRCSYSTDSVKIIPLGGIPVTNNSKYTIEQTGEDGNRQLGTVVARENLVFKNLGAGTYTYKIKDANECTLSDKVKLRKPDTLKITTVDFTIPTCHEGDMGDVSKRTDGEILVKAMGGISFADGYDYLLNKLPLSEAKGRFDSIRGISEVVFNHLETGEYVVEVRDINGCITKKDKQRLKQPDWLHIENFNSVTPECYEAKDGFWTSEVLGGTSASGNYSFIISKDEQDFRNGTTGKEWNQDQLGKGKYLLEITDDLGCYYKQVEELLQPDEMAIDFDVMGVTDFGNNDGAVQARVRGGNGAYRYQWYYKGEKYPDGDRKKIEQIYAGEYTVEVWDKNNCPYGNNEFGIANGLKKTASVIEPGSELSIVACPVKASYYGAEDGTIQVSAVGGWPYAQWPGYEFSLDHGDWRVTSQFENLKAGLYQLRVKDSKGIMDSTNVEIKEPEEIIIQLDKSNCLCNDDASGSITVNATGGTSPFTYAINYALAFNNSNEFHGLKSGNYRVFVKDKLGNIQDKYINIEEPELLSVELLNLDNSTCNSRNGSAQINITGGTPDYYIDWTSLYPTNKLYPDNLAAGDYRVKVVDANLCSDSLSFKIEEKRGPEIRLKELKEVKCHEAKDGEISIEINNGTAPYNIVWKDFETANLTEIKQLSKGEYAVVVSDANNCFDEAEYEVTGPKELELYVSSSISPNCVGINDGSIQTAAVGGSPEYIYRLNDKLNMTGWFPNLGAENFQIEVEDSNGCTKVVNTELIEPTPLTIDLPQAYVLCQNQTQIVNAEVVGSTSEWFYDGGYFSSENEVELSEEGVYRLKLMSEKGCEAQHDFSITYLDYEVVADFIIPVEAIVGDTIVAVDISWELPDSVKWDFPEALELIKKDEASIWLRVLEAGEHTVGISIFKNECSDYMEKQIRVENTSNERKAGFIQPNKVYITDAKLFPNPNKGDFHLKLVLNKIADVDIEIYDVQRGGKIDIRKGKNNAAYQFDFNNRSVFKPNNLYAIVISAGDEKRVLKFFVY